MGRERSFSETNHRSERTIRVRIWTEMDPAAERVRNVKCGGICWDWLCGGLSNRLTMRKLCRSLKLINKRAI